jgi:ribosomal 50S subunit-recycling heat shock protein
MVNIGTEKKFFPGTLGTFAKIMLGDEEANLDTVIHDGARITIIPGENGTTPSIRLGDLVTAGQEYTIYINGREKHIRQRVTINGKEADADQLLADGDTIESREFKSLGEALLAAGYPPTGRKIHYKLNGNDTTYSCTPEILLNDNPASISMPIHEGDHVEYIADEEPKLGDILNLSNSDTSIVIYYENAEYQIPSASVELTVNGRKASPGTLIDDGCEITYVKSERTATTVSDALLAVNFQPPAATSRVTFTILVNGQPVDFTDPVKNGDSLEVRLTSLETPAAPAMPAAAPQPAAPTPAPSISSFIHTPQPAPQPITPPATPAAPAGTQPRRRTIADFIRTD